mgnify:CR=1 FL=1
MGYAEGTAKAMEDAARDREARGRGLHFNGIGFGKYVLLRLGIEEPLENVTQ